MSATPKGVENHRRAALEEIVKNRNENLASEIEEGGGNREDIGLPKDDGAVDPRKPADISPEAWNAMSDEEKGNAIAAAQAPKQEEKPVEEQPAAEVVEEQPAKRYKGKVDGQEVEFEEQAVIEAGLRALQKESAADKRLEEATKAREEAERLRQRVEQTLQQAQPTQQKKPDQEVLLAKDGLRDIVKKIQYGSEDEAADALLEYGKKMAVMGQSQSLTQAELNNLLDLRDAQKYVRSEFPEVLQDQKLKVVFEATVNQKLAAGDNRSYQEICKDAVEEVRQWRAPAEAKPTPPAGGPRSQAQQRKQNIVVIPAAQARQPAPPQTKEPTPSDVIAKMREARGQA